MEIKVFTPLAPPYFFVYDISAFTLRVSIPVHSLYVSTLHMYVCIEVYMIEVYTTSLKTFYPVEVFVSE